MGRWFESSTTHHFPPLYTLASSGNYEASSWVCAKITGQYLIGIPPMTANNLIAELASSSASERVHEPLERAWSAPQYSPAQQKHYKERIREQLQRHNAVLVAHYYTDPLIQALAEE